MRPQTNGELVGVNSSGSIGTWQRFEKHITPLIEGLEPLLTETPNKPCFALNMSIVRFPKLITSSVVRGSEKGQSHGGVYIVDFASQSVEQHIDWNKSDIDFAGRGWDRGLRGIEFSDDLVWIAASDELFAYNKNFQLVASSEAVSLNITATI